MKFTFHIVNIKQFFYCKSVFVYNRFTFHIVNIKHNSEGIKNEQKDNLHSI